MDAALVLKGEGNDSFKAKDFSSALQKYKDGLNNLLEIETDKEIASSLSKVRAEGKEEEKKLAGVLLTNGAAAALQLNQASSCIEMCNFALSLDNTVSLLD